MRLLYIILLLAIVYSGLGQTDTLRRIVTDTVTIRGASITLPLARTEIVLDSTIAERTTFAPLVNTTSGIWMQSGALNTHRISIRGVGNREPFATSKLRAYLDEIPLTNGIGESSIEDISPAILDRLQIWRSPGSVIWGSGLGGLLLLKTKSTVDDGLNLLFTGGSFGRRSADVAGHLAYGNDNTHRTRVHYGYLSDDGFRANNAYRRHATTLLHKWRISNHAETSLFVHRIDLRAFIPSSLDLETFTSSPESAAANWASVRGHEDYIKWIAGLGYHLTDRDRWVIRGSFFTTYFHSDEVRPFNVLNEKDETTGLRFRAIHNLIPSLTVSLGTEVLFEEYAARTFETLNSGMRGAPLGMELEERSYINIYSDVQWQAGPRLQFHGGVNAHLTMFESDTIEVESPLHVNPVLGCNFELIPAKCVAFGSLSRGVSPVSIANSRNADGTINRDLKPESGWSIETGIRYTGGKSSAELTVYRMLIDNLVVQKRLAPDIYEAANTGQTLHQGIELAWQLPVRKWLTWSGAWTLTDHRFKEFVDGDDNFSGNDLTGSAPYILHNALKLEWGAFSIHADQHFIDRTPITDDNTVYGPSSHVFNLLASWKFTNSKNWTIRPALRIENLFDTRYASMYQINAQGFGSAPRYYYPGKPRAVYVSIRFELVGS